VFRFLACEGRDGQKTPRLVHLSLSGESTLDIADGTHHLHSVANNLLRAILCEVVLGSAIGLSVRDGYSSGLRRWYFPIRTQAGGATVQK
jgi:hypothetical protein